jgi:transcriptional regulator with XRE-family HTH domain
VSETSKTTIGDRIAELRRRFPLTQEELAERAGVSVGVITKLEQNERTSARIPTLHKLAQALRVPTESLIGDAAQATTRREPDDDDDLGMLEVRRVLTPARGLGGYTVGGDDEKPASLVEVLSSVRLVDELYHHDKYTSTLRALPSLVTDARQVAGNTAGEEQERAYSALAAAYRTMGKTLLQLRRLDLAHTALSAGLDAAEKSSDPIRHGATVVRTMCWLLTRQGRFADAERLAVATADRVEPKFSKAAPIELANWGWLLLYASGAAARNNRPGDVREQLDAAAAAALRIGDLPPVRWDDVEMGGFSSPKVQMMRVEAAVVAGEPGLALSLAAKVEPSHVPTPSCRYRHQLDVAWAHLETGESAGNAKAGEVLMSLGRKAPAWMIQQRYARDLVDQLTASRRRAMSDDLAQLAALVGADASGSRGGGSSTITE